MPVITKATAHTSTRRRSSVRCSTSVMASGWGRASLRRFREMAMGLGSSCPVVPARPGRVSSCPGSSGTDHPGGSDLVDDAAGIGDQHPGDPRAPPRWPAPPRPVCWRRTTAARRLRWHRVARSRVGPGGGPVLGAWVSARLSRKDSGERTAWVMFSVEGRSGNVPRTSLSSLSRNRRKSPHRPPICLATLGSLSGPSTMRATTRMTSTFAGLRNGTFSSVPAARRSGRAWARETTVGGRSQALDLADRPDHRHRPTHDQRPGDGAEPRLSSESMRLSPIT